MDQSGGHERIRTTNLSNSTPQPQEPALSRPSHHQLERSSDAANRELSTRERISGGLWEKLPTEIAITIWELAFNSREPRLIHLKLLNRCSETEGNPVIRTRTRLQISSLVLPSPIPAVCKQSRYAALKACGLATGEASLALPRIWCLPEIDTLLLDSALMRRLRESGDPGMFSRCGLDLSRVQKLAIIRPTHDEDRAYFTNLLENYFRDLNMVHLVRESYMPDNVNDLIMMEHFYIDELTDLYLFYPGIPTNRALASLLDGLVQSEAQKQLALIGLPIQTDKDGRVYEGPSPIRLLLGTVTTPERRKEFNQARMKFFMGNLH